MAIEIIPKAAIKKQTGLNYIFYFSLVLLVVSLIIWLVLGTLIKSGERTIEGLEASLAEERSPERKAFEKEILTYKSKLEDFSNLLDSHQLSSNFFKYLESLTHPKVLFSDLSLNLNESRAKLSGVTDTFESLGQQILILREQDAIHDLKLTDISMGKEAGIDFTVDFYFDPKILK